MPVHEWSRVDAGTFHAFHTAWITHLCETFNGGLLPSGYYTLPEQHAGTHIADVLTLHSPQAAPSVADEGGVAVADAPPQTQRKLTASSPSRGRRPASAGSV
jgi:hypothetical protein